MALSCRPQSATGMPSPSRTPVPVRHPLSAVSYQHNNLNVTGSSARNIMPFRDINDEHYHYIVPKRLNEPLDFSVPQRKKLELRGLPRLNLDEIEMTLMEKLRKERYAVRCLFRNNDTMDRGYVTKGALLKIMYTLCGSIRVEHFHKLLEKYNLDEHPVITFEQIERAFGPRSPSDNRRWLATRLANRHVSVAHAQTMLRERAEHANFDLQSVLPESCFLPQGLILKPQWREALELIGIRMSDQDYERFWTRFDREGTGAVPTSVVCTMLNLNCSGRPKAPCRSVKSVGTARTGGKSAGSNASARGDPPDSAKNVEKAPKKTKEKRFVKQLDVIKSRRPRYNDIKSCLFYLFEESYNAIIAAFQQFDHKGDSHLSRFDFRHVLKEHGFTISQPDLDAFLARIGMRIGHNVHYREFCNKFQSRAEFSLVNRIITNSQHPFNIANNRTGDGSLTPEEMEMKMVEFFQGHFLQFLGILRKADHDKRGLVPLATVLSAIESVLGYSVGEMQMAQFKELLRFDKKSGDVFYNDLLQLFNKPPNTWHRRREDPPMPAAAKIIANGRVEPTVTPQPLPPEAFEDALPAVKDPTAGVSAEVTAKIGDEKAMAKFASLCAVVEQLLRIRFHSVDKMFKLLDVRNSGRITKAIFAQLIRNHNIKCTDEEMDNLWGTLRTDPAKMNYRQILRHFMTNMTNVVAECNTHIKKSQLHRRLPPLNGLKDPNLARLREHRRQQTARAEATEKPKPPAIDPPVVSEAEVAELCSIIAPQIIEHWEPLKNQLRSLDQVGYATVECHHMLRIFQDLKLPLSDEQALKLINFFDAKKNARFNYIDFLKRFSQPVEKNPAVFNKVTHELKDKKTGQSATMVQILEKIRQNLLHEWKSLLRSFRKMDTQRTGYVTETELKKVLRDQHIHLSNEDLYHLLTEFDINFDGKIVYNEFIALILNVF